MRFRNTYKTRMLVTKTVVFKMLFKVIVSFQKNTGLTSSHIAAKAFTWGTIAVLPFYTLMVVAPNAKLTKRTMESNTPYIILGALYSYLLYLSWSPSTLQTMFASKYWLPQLSGICSMFSKEMTVASAWIHLLAVDLAARQVYCDGILNNVETRHSISLCLLFCPVGIAIHAITKALTKYFLNYNFSEEMKLGLRS